MQISIQKLIDNEESKEEIAAAMLKNYEDCGNIFSDEDEPLEVFDTIDRSFLVADICQEYDLYYGLSHRSTILKINDSYFSWNYRMNARYGGWEFYGCRKVVPVKKTILDVDFIPVSPYYNTKKETEAYKKIFHTGL